MIKIIKSIVKGLFALFGVGVYQLPKKREGKVEKPIDPVWHNTKEGLNAFYSDPRKVKGYLEPARIEFYKNVIAFCEKSNIDLNKKKIIDVGCGTGHMLKYINSKYNVVSLVGFEYSSEAIKVARVTCPNAVYYEGDITNETIVLDDSHKGLYDVLFCLEVLEHLHHPDRALNCCLDLVQKGGCVIVTVPNGRKDAFLVHINFWSPESWEVFVEKNCEAASFRVGQLSSNINYAIIYK